VTTIAVPISQLASDWQAPPDIVVGTALAAASYLIGFQRLRARGRADYAPVGSLLLFLSGLAVLLLALCSPLDAAGDEYLLSAHMLQHLLIGDAAPALLLLGMRGPLGLFAVPRPVLRRLGRSRRARAALGALGRPGPAMGASMLVMAGWHVPAAYDFALSHEAAHRVEHLSFLVAGLLVWNQIVDPARRARLRVGQRAAYATSLLASGMVLSWVLIVSHPLYLAYVRQPLRLMGISPRGDQVQAGLVMMAEQSVTLGTAAALLVWVALRAVGRPDAPTGRLSSLGRCVRLLPGQARASAIADSSPGASRQQVGWLLRQRPQGAARGGSPRPRSRP